MRESLPACMYTNQVISILGAHRIQKMESNSDELEVWTTMWVLGHEPEPSVNAVSALNRWVMFSVQQSLSCYKADFYKIWSLKQISL